MEKGRFIAIKCVQISTWQTGQRKSHFEKMGCTCNESKHRTINQLLRATIIADAVEEEKPKLCQKIKWVLSFANKTWPSIGTLWYNFCFWCLFVQPFLAWLLLLVKTLVLVSQKKYFVKKTAKCWSFLIFKMEYKLQSFYSMVTNKKLQVSAYGCCKSPLCRRDTPKNYE